MLVGKLPSVLVWTLATFILLVDFLFVKKVIVTAYSSGQPQGQCAGLPDLTICDPTQAGLCLNQTCSSACAIRQMLHCNCPSEDDNHCYLCCGNTQNPCQPAHVYRVFKPNGERWEREACRRCHDLPDGVPCDDKSDRRICLNKKCTANACLNQPEGAYCDLRKTRLCVDSDCRDPCREHSSMLTTCECDGQKSRCELCCYDFRSKQCESAFRKYGIRNKDGRPVARIGLSCNRKQEQCNMYGRCASSALRPFWPMVAFACVAYALLCFR